MGHINGKEMQGPLSGETLCLHLCVGGSATVFQLAACQMRVPAPHLSIACLLLFGSETGSRLEI